MLMPTGSGFIKGKHDIEAFWHGVMDMGIKNVQLTVVEVENHGNTAIEIGQYILSGPDDQTIDQGKYIVIWKLEGESWKLHRDIWNSSLPPQ
jgi:ketosteroid isomerase-like protein